MNGGHYFNSVAKEQVLAVLEKNGMLAPDKTYKQVVEKKIAQGQKLWDTVIGDAVGQELREFYETSIKESGRFYHIEHIPRYAAFGYDVADCFCRLFDVERKFADDVVVLGTLLNSYAALFDKICDDYTELRPDIMRRCSPGNLFRAASLIRSDTKPFFRLKENDAPLVKIVVLLMREYFNRCAVVFDRFGNDNLRAEFQSAVSQLYKSELMSVKLIFSTRVSKRKIYEILRAKSSLLIWLLVLPCLSFGVEAMRKDFRKLKKAVLSFGDIFWILDDIVDAADDFRRGIWGYPLLKFFSPDENKQECDALILDKMISSGVISSVADEMCSKYRSAKADFSKIAGNDLDFDKIFLPWFRTWIDSMARPSFRE